MTIWVAIGAIVLFLLLLYFSRHQFLRDELPKEVDYSVVTADNSSTYEWHTVSYLGPRVVPYCKDYAWAPALLENELKYLFEKDLLRTDKAHARCILRKSVHAAPLPKKLDDLANAPTLLDSVKRMGGYEHVAHVTQTDDARTPYLFVLRDGSRYLSLALRNTQGVIQRRMVALDALTGLLDEWKRVVDARSLGKDIQYCLCGTHVGILDRISFFYNRHNEAAGPPETQDANKTRAPPAREEPVPLGHGQGQWEVWLHPTVASVNRFGGRVNSVQNYKEGVSSFAYRQNVELLKGAGSDGHYVHYTSITPHYLDPLHVRIPDDLEPLELFWTGNGNVPRTYSESHAPFALALPLTAEAHGTERKIGGTDAACYYHCELLHTHLLHATQTD